jgi:YbbR domain-containing protein
MTQQRRRQLIQNGLWFLGSVALAFVVWFVAAIQADPVQQRSYRNIPVRLQADNGLIVTNNPTELVRVTVRAQQSVLDLLTSDDIDVAADLRNLSPGTHSVPLNVNIGRPASADTQPTQIRVELKQVVAQQKPVRITVTELPAADFGFEDPMPERGQVEVRGAANDVNAVATVRGDIDLSERRNPFELDVQLAAYNADGRRISDVTIDPGSVRVQVTVFRRDNVRQISVSPDILIETLDDDFTLASFDYRPRTVFISGSPEQINRIGDTLRTQPISLEGRMEDFVTNVPLRLPPGDLLAVDGQTSIEVTIGIVARTTARQFDNVPIETIGLPQGLQVQDVSPDSISVLLNGSIAVIDQIESDDIQAVLDLSGVTAGNNDIEPTIIIEQGQLQVNRIEPLPASINVAVIQPTPAATPETTAEPSNHREP